MRAIWFASFIAAGLLFTTEYALAYKEVKCFVLRAPEKPLSGIKRIAVLDFEGPQGRDASDRLVSFFLDSKRGIHAVQGPGFFSSTQEGRTYQEWATTKIFDIVERTRLEQIMREQQLGQTGIIDNTQAANIGRVLGVDAIVTGSLRSEVSDSRTTEKRTKHKSKKEGGGSYEITVGCVERNVTGTMKMRVVSVETAQILAVRESVTSRSDKKCEDETDAVSSAQTLLADAVGAAASELASYISPTFLLAEMELKKVKGKDYEQKADDAAKLAEKGELGKAYLVFSSISQDDPYNPEALYDLGILNEAVGNFVDAKSAYEGALSLKSDEKDYQDGLSRVKKALDFSAVLGTIGVPVTVHQWNVSASAVAEATAQKIAVKGDREDRQEVKDKPASSGAVVAKVPGGIELVVLGKEGDWFKVKLMGGKEGYLHVSQVKD